MPGQPQVDQRDVIELLCTDLSETARAERLGIARSSYYKWLKKLTDDGVIINRGTVWPAMTFTGAHPRSRYSGTHHAPVQHIWWSDDFGDWAVQGALLDLWDPHSFRSNPNDTVVAIRWQTVVGECYRTAFVTKSLTQWSTRDTEKYLPGFWQPLPKDTLKAITVAIARVLDTKAILIPEEPV